MSYSHNTSEQGTAGDVSDVEHNTNRRLKAYRIAIFGDEAERTHVLTQIIAIPCVSLVINTGEVTDEKTILNLKRNSWENRVTPPSKFVRSRIGKKTIK